MKPTSSSLTEPLNVEKTQTVHIEIPPSSDGSESTINDDTDYDLRARDFEAETTINEVHTGEIVSFTALRNPRNLINIEEANIDIDKTSNAYKEFKLLDRFGQMDSETKRVVCKLCEKSWNVKDRPQSQLRYHVDSVHMEKYLSCRFCRKEFFSVVTFIRHYKTHLRQENFMCEECGLNARDKTTLSRHKAIVHLNQKNFKCELCDRSFKNPNGLSMHIQSRHEDKPYPCPYCNHISVNAGSLNLHKRLKHENVKSFKCKDCDYVCHRTDYLSRHKRSIHENVRFPCDQCEYQATRKQYLESHIKKIHEKE